MTFAAMTSVCIALANIREPATPKESVVLATSAVAEAGRLAVPDFADVGSYDGRVPAGWREMTLGGKAGVTGVLFVLLASWLFVRGCPQATPRQLMWVGAGWLAATVAFEFGLGFYSGLGWRALLAEYNIFRGRLWSLIVLSVFLGPWLCGVVDRR